MASVERTLTSRSLQWEGAAGSSRARSARARRRGPRPRRRVLCAEFTHRGRSRPNSRWIVGVVGDECEISGHNVPTASQHLVENCA